MKLTRRDALAALAAVGAGAAAAGGGSLLDGPALSEHDRETLVSLAVVVYPSAVEGVAAFVERYAVGRTEDRPDYRRGMHEAVGELDDYARDWYGGDFADLPPGERDAALRDMGVDSADADPEGTPRERVRHYLVNDLLYALYATPTGGDLVGIENPPGHPGGTASYQRGPSDGG